MTIDLDAVQRAVSLTFDGDKEAPARPENNCTNLPPIGSPAWEQNVSTELAARARAGSGINHTRAAVLAADKAAADKTRAEQGVTKCLASTI